jgi:hypothetical protein
VAAGVRRLLVALVVLVVLAGAVVGGIVLDRTVLDDDGTTITEAEHDRLIDMCNRVGDYSAPAACTAWIAVMVERAEKEGMTYVELTEAVAQGLEETTNYPPATSYDPCKFPLLYPEADC